MVGYSKYKMNEMKIKVIFLSKMLSSDKYHKAKIIIGK